MKKILVCLALTLGFSHAQAPEKADYRQCDFHVSKSTLCGLWNQESSDGIIQLILGEENDTMGLTYLSFECISNGDIALYVQSKNPLLTQDDFDLKILPKVSYRFDNGALKAMKVYPAMEADANGQAIADLGAVQLFGPSVQQITTAKRIQLVIERNSMSKLTYSFPIYGLDIGLKVIKYCKRG